MNENKYPTSLVSCTPLLLTVVLLLLPAVATAQFAGGSGTEEAPYQVETLEQLQAIADSANLDKHFIQVADIDAGETENWNNGKGFEPIGDRTFFGTFDGNGYVIVNLVINRPDENNVGLFRETSSAKGGEILRLGLENAEITGKNFVGTIAGRNFAGYTHSSFATGKVSGRDYVGGLYGYFEMVDGYGCIISSYAHVNTSGIRLVGGIAGYHSAIFFGAMEDQSPEVWNTQINNTTYYSGNNLYAMHEVYASGSVSGEEKVGGLIGEAGGDFDASYWDVETTGQNEGFGLGLGSSEGIKGLTTDQMTGQDAYIHMYELDFDQTWQLTEGYPVLAWQEPADAVDQPEVPIVRVAPKEEEYNYGEVETDSYASRSYTLRNTGNIVMSGEVSLTDTRDSTFEIIQGKGAYSLDPDNSMVVEVAFHPFEEDTFFQTILDIHHDAPNRGDPLMMVFKGTGKTATYVDEEKSLQQHPQLQQNYPNPFNPVTTIGFSIPERTHVQITVYNAIGQKVAALVNEVRSAGWYDVDFDAEGLSSGIFLYRMEAGGQVEVKQMTLIK